MDKQLRLSLIFKAAGNARNFLGGLSADSRRTGEALNAARSRLNDLQRTARDVSSFRASEVRLAQLREELQGARVEARRLAEAHEATTNPTRAMSRAFEVAKARLTELGDKEQGQIRALAELEGKLRSAGVSTSALGLHERRLARDIQAANGELSEQARRIEAVQARQRRMTAARGRYDQAQAMAGSTQGAGMSAVAGAGIAAAPLVLSARAAMTFEDAMADVRKVVDFPTPEAFRNMSNDILALSGRLPVASEELANIMAQGARAGVPRAELLAYTEAAAKMGVAFDVSSEEAGSMMATWRTAFGLAQPGVIALADRVNALTNSYGGNAAAVAEMITRIGPLAGVAGVAEGSLAAIAQLMNSVGVQSEIGATGIKNMMLALTKGEAATRMQREALSGLGLEAGAVAAGMQRDAEGTITQVLDRISGLSKDRQASVLSQLFGSESVGAIAPLLTNLDSLKRNFREVANSQFYASSMDKEYQARSATTSNALRLARNNANALAVEIGTTMLPAIQGASRFLSGAAQNIRQFAAAHPGAVKIAAALVAVLAAGMLVFGGLAVAAAAILGPFALLQLTLTQTSVLFGPLGQGIGNVAARALPLLGRGLAIARTAMLGFNLALLANPITWIVLGVVALAAGAFLIYRNWGRIGPWLAGVWSRITGAVRSGLSAIGRAIMNFAPIGFIIRNWAPITDFFGALFDAAGAVVGLGMDYLKLAILRFTPLGFIIQNWSAITGALSTIWNGAKAAVAAGVQAAIGLVMNYTPMGAIVRNWGAITGFIGQVWSNAKTAVNGGIAAIRSAIANFGPLQAFQRAFDGVWTWLAGLPARMLTAGADIIRGFTAGINGQRANVQAATAAVARVPEATTRRETRTKSPSRVMMAVGRDVMAGFSVGLGQMGSDPAKQMRRAAAGVLAAAGIAVPAMAGASDFAIGQPTPTFERGARIGAVGSAAAAGGGGGPAQGVAPSIGSVTIQIFQQPGQDAQALAQEVARILQSPNLAVLGDQGSDSHGETH